MSDQQLLRDYWEYWRLARGCREERLQAGELRHPHDGVADAVEAGDPSVVDLLVALAEAAPSDSDAGLIGAGPLEELLSVHRGRLATAGGADLLDAIDVAARRSSRFRRALQSVDMGAEVSEAVKQRLQRFSEPPRP